MDNILNIVRKHEQFQSNLTKIQPGMVFIKTCKVEQLLPIFANSKLATQYGNKKLKMKLSRLIMEPERK